ncbi:MAG: hypothetical protein ACD_20C00234G0008 [uncultured bacterium]|nr:MAG: hypothetical protein ACD_20C00234G0008 [uncultured bacterium]HBH18789.1 hypothetical protein [Cyanobacteria bacterium UBA9579]
MASITAYDEQYENFSNVIVLNSKKAAIIGENGVKNPLKSYQNFHAERLESMSEFNQIMHQMDQLIRQGDFESAQKLMPKLNSNTQTYPLSLNR